MNQEELRRKRLKRKKIERAVCIILLVILAVDCGIFALIAVRLHQTGYFDRNTSAAEVTSETEAASSDTTGAPETVTAETTTEAETSESYSVVLESSENEDESSAAYVEPAGNGKTYSDPGLRLWVGDSRTVGMEMYTTHTDQEVYIAEVGMAYDWFEGSALPQMEEYLETDTVSKVYILMGVNDCAAAYNNSGYNPAEEYTELINGLILENPLVEFYFVSVGPGVGDYYGSVNIAEMNDYIDTFNSYMEKYCGATYIDAAEYLKETGFESTDGIHYTAATYQKMYYYVLDNSCYLISE